VTETAGLTDADGLSVDVTEVVGLSDADGLGGGVTEAVGLPDADGVAAADGVDVLVVAQAQVSNNARVKAAISGKVCFFIFCPPCGIQDFNIIQL